MITEKRSGESHTELCSKRSVHHFQLSLPEIIFRGGVSASKISAQGLDVRY